VDSEGSQHPSAAGESSLLLEPGHTLGTVTDKISSIVLSRGTTKGWLFGFALTFPL
jgi:hypothetical protein